MVMKKELFPVKADGGYIFDAHGASIAMFHATEWNKTTGGVYGHDVTQNAKDIASALNNTWGQGINPEAVPAMYDYLNQFAKKDFPDAANIIKQATLEPEKDILGMWVRCQSKRAKYLTMGTEYEVCGYKYQSGELTLIQVVNDEGSKVVYVAINFSEPFDKPKPVFTSADGAPKDIKGYIVTCQTDDCKSLTNGKSYKVVQGNYRGDDLVYIHVVNDKGHNQGYYFTTFTDPVPPEEPVFAYCLEIAGLWLTKNKGYKILNEDTSKNIIFITNDRGLNKWYDKDMFTSEKPVVCKTVRCKVANMITLTHLAYYEVVLETKEGCNVVNDEGDIRFYSWEHFFG